MKKRGLTLVEAVITSHVAVRPSRLNQKGLERLSNSFHKNLLPYLTHLQHPNDGLPDDLNPENPSSFSRARQPPLLLVTCLGTSQAPFRPLSHVPKTININNYNTCKLSRILRDAETGGSNPLIPTRQIKGL